MSTLTAAQVRQLDNSYVPGGLNLGTKLSSDETRVASLEAAGLYLIKETVGFGDITPAMGAGVAQVFPFTATAPAKSLILARWVDLNVLFTGAGVTVCDMDFGDDGDPDGWIDGSDVLGGSTGPIKLGGGAYAVNMGAGLFEIADILDDARTPSVTLIPDGAESLSALDTGSLTAYVLYAAIPLGGSIG